MDLRTVEEFLGRTTGIDIPVDSAAEAEHRYREACEETDRAPTEAFRTQAAFREYGWRAYVTALRAAELLGNENLPDVQTPSLEEVIIENTTGLLDLWTKAMAEQAGVDIP